LQGPKQHLPKPNVHLPVVITTGIGSASPD
jgi:hypothetical protein